jgi:hypothetical protein
VGRLAPHLLDYEQQDCQEFLRFLLDGMSEDLCRKRPSASEPSIENSPRSNQTPQAIDPRPTPPFSPVPSASSVPAIYHSRCRYIPDHPNNSCKREEDGASQREGLEEALAMEAAELSPTPPLVQKRMSARTVDRLRAMTLNAAATSPNNPLDSDQPNLLDSTRAPAQSTHRNGNQQPSDTPPDKSTRRRVSSEVGQSRGGHCEILAEIRGTQEETSTASQLRRGKTGESEHPLIDAQARANSTLAEKESAKAWAAYLNKNDSIITDLFGGQLQSCIECLCCHHRSLCFDPFLDLSVPIVNMAPSPHPNQSRDPVKCTLESCLQAFSGPTPNYFSPPI